jgi:hypothetical protein
MKGTRPMTGKGLSSLSRSRQNATTMRMCSREIRERALTGAAGVICRGAERGLSVEA